MNNRLMMHLKIIVGAVIVSLLAACSSTSTKVSKWPTEMPPREIFVASYEGDLDNKRDQSLDEYLLWVERFYEGWELYHNGWITVTADSLHGVKDPAMAQEIKTKMDLIGKKVASEWAKNKKSRRIVTRHVVVWGNALVESMKRDQEIALINRVLVDIDALMAEQIALDDVKAERYFPKDKDDVFF